MIQDRSTIPSDFTSLIQKSLLPFQFTANDIKDIINKLDPDKAHGYDMISIRMISYVVTLSTIRDDV